MAARRHDYAYVAEDDVTALETCLHDQARSSRSSSTSGLYRFERGTATRSGVVPINRSSAPSPPSIPRPGTVPEFVVGDRISAFAFHAPPRKLPIAGLMIATVMFLAMTVLASIAYYR